MDGKKDFTLNPMNYPRPKLLEFLDKIHIIGMKYVVIVDSGIAVNASYGVYQRGMANDVFIKHDGDPFLGQVWPGAAYFPDVLNLKTVSWWSDAKICGEKAGVSDSRYQEGKCFVSWCCGDFRLT
ncbi:hypothetical protein HN51_046817 [Arachis hypogaea]|nr:Alpha-xylosidase [Arachis hypogaea]